MHTVDLIAFAPHMYTMEGEGVGYKADHALVVDGGKIVAVMKKEEALRAYQAEKVLALPHHVLLPGLIDAHMHTGSNILRGLAQDTGYWMMYGVQPFSLQQTIEDYEAGSKVAMIEAIKAGTTTLGDYQKDMQGRCEFLAKLGARGIITQTIRDAVKRVYEPGELYEFSEELGEQSLGENLALYDKWHGYDSGRIRVMFGPQGADFVSRDLLKRIYQLAKERNTRVHMHTQQGDRETAQMEMRYDMRPVAWLKQEGLLNETLLAVHLTDCTEKEAQMVANSGASMIVCPGSIGIIDGIVPPSLAFQRAGGAVALGSDQACGNNCHNIFNEMKLVALFNKIKEKDPEVLPAWRALRMATIEGAKALGMHREIGSLEQGKRADFIAVDTMQPSMMPIYTHPMRNMVPNLVYSARGCEVDVSVVEGRVIMEHQKLLAVDETQYLEQMQTRAQDLGQRATEMLEKIHGTNAVFMEEGKL